ncbi:hypothetical protein [Aneurinibacillus thermoaerophilus]|uniref:hypothetical protein n=1 Tax=Aneurinibacillus thermoaerophilus TaxID=143495 RepID=UPI002E20E3C3|nr:hypothetical protein [Aneurinibacillus thermoaerophilus]MED0735643.1 hypothetical protein [Aneurinibacillus thermoaerophilus]
MDLSEGGCGEFHGGLRKGRVCLRHKWNLSLTQGGTVQRLAAYIMNRRIPNGTYGGVRGRGLVTPSYSIRNK